MRLAALLCAVGLTAPTPAVAHVCRTWMPVPPPSTAYYCSDWAPNTPLGWTHTYAGTRTLTNGQVLLCTGTNLTGICIITNIGAGGVFQAMSFDDYDTFPATPGFKIQSYKTNLSRASTLYNYASLNGAGVVYTIPAGNQTMNLFNVFQISSALFQN
jgi:hypothetical protein